MPKARPRLSCGSASTASVRPLSPKTVARFTAVEVLPTPPLLLQIASRMRYTVSRPAQHRHPGSRRVCHNYSGVDRNALINAAVSSGNSIVGLCPLSGRISTRAPARAYRCAERAP